VQIPKTRRAKYKNLRYKLSHTYLHKYNVLLEVEEIKFKHGGWSNMIVFIIGQIAFSD